ncbi:hypothetical protein [Mesorhizobium sp. M2A.F.Ca.ET.039.01.1.1]|uniref:hypothetical protein n=1 Tax=Mesorhizobium sp. M2A.F.Ca.ET.039.01.1.1 TaxID=2496746 RepID=UPI000FCC33C4|nr:hypothetical protein [Mesorhizobium sp. M2A.F.Ca.ET.039.01.1.1]RWX72549.1 hypothetical protein EOA24_00730 [Mesorhizobium sp. M2A.F.Ca.ET.039.01.1.1]
MNEEVARDEEVQERDPLLPQEPEPKPEKPKPIGLNEMALVIVTEAMRRSSSARAIEKEFGPAHAPSDKALREIEVLHATARFLDTLMPILPEIKKLLKPKKK